MNTPASPTLEPTPRPRRPILSFLKRRLRSWLVRHQLPFNFWIHMIGIPLAFTGLGLLLLSSYPWYWGALGLVVGYFLQWVGHQAEGNDVGEWAGIKKLLGLPCVAISPRWEQQAKPKSSEEAN